MLLHLAFVFEADSKVKPAKASKLFRYFFYTKLSELTFRTLLAVKLSLHVMRTYVCVTHDLFRGPCSTCFVSREK